MVTVAATGGWHAGKGAPGTMFLHDRFNSCVAFVAILSSPDSGLFDKRCLSLRPIDLVRFPDDTGNAAGQVDVDGVTSRGHVGHTGRDLLALTAPPWSVDQPGTGIRQRWLR